MPSAPFRACTCAAALLCSLALSKTALAQQSRPLGPAQLQRDANLGRVPAGSFIRRPVVSVQDLVQEVNDDPVVAERYGRLFHMSPDAVRDQFRSLHHAVMSQDQIMRVYYAHGDTLGYKLRRVKAGTPIFAFADGTPVLVQVCGNPLRATLIPPALALQVPDFSPTEEVPGVSPNVPPQIAEAPMEVPSPWPFGPPAPVVPGPVVPGFVEEVAMLPPGAPGQTTLWPLLFLPLLGLIHGGGGNQVFPGPVPPPPGPTPTPQVPEPGVIVMLGSAGLAGLASVRLRIRGRSWRV